MKHPALWRKTGISLAFVAAALMLVPGFAWAQSGVDLSKLKINLITGLDLFSALAAVLRFVLLIGGILAFFYVLYGGFVYITSGGDPAKATGGQKMITNAIIGIILIAISYALVAWVIDLTGRNLNVDGPGVNTTGGTTGGGTTTTLGGCENRVDDDRDGRIDRLDNDCWTPAPTRVYVPSLSETNPAQ